MPRRVDPTGRRTEILQATVAVLAEKGPRRLSLGAVAARMGGSSTLVTHYIRSRQELLDSLVDLVDWWRDELATLEVESSDPQERLRRVLEWLLPLDEHSFVQEQARINPLGEPDARLRTRPAFEAWDRYMRRVVGDHLRGLVPDNRLEPTVELLRVITNGVCISAVEHPNQWPRERQIAVIDHVLALLNLDSPTSGSD